MAVGTLAPVGRRQFLDANGRPLAGGRITTYAAGTTTPLATYQDVTLTAANTNPIILDSRGQAAIYCGPHAYTFVVADAEGVQQWTEANVTPPAPYNVDLDIEGIAGESLTAGQVVFLSDGSGGRTAGRWYKTDADDTAMSSLAAMIGMLPASIALGATGLVRLQGRMAGLTGLSPGAVYYCSATAGALTASAPANARLVGVADSSASLVLFGAAVGNTVTVSEIGFTPLASSGASGDIVATINASTEGLTIDADLIVINADVTFASGYDPTGKIASGGAAADVTANSTTISGSKIRAGSLESNTWGTTAGTRFNLVDGTFELGGSSAPKLSWNGTTLAVTGTINVTGGNAETTTGSQAKADAAQTTAIATASSDATAKANAAAAASLSKAQYLYNGGVGYTTINGSAIQPGTIAAGNIIAGTVTGWIVTGSTIHGGAGQEVLIDSTGISVVPSTSAAFDDPNAYRFRVSGGSASPFGLAASESADHLRRSLYLEADNIGSGTRRGTVGLTAIGNSATASLLLDGNQSASYARLYANTLEFAGYSGGNATECRVWADATYLYGHVLPDSTASARRLGSASHKWKTAHFNLSSNTAPAYVVVNDPSDSSALGYCAGYTGTVVVAGAGTLTFKAGVLTGVA